MYLKYQKLNVNNHFWNLYENNESPHSKQNFPHHFISFNLK